MKSFSIIVSLNDTLLFIVLYLFKFLFGDKWFGVSVFLSIEIGVSVILDVNDAAGFCSKA
jgi:hypothetical protein